jgi:hypothetical protein
MLHISKMYFQLEKKNITRKMKGSKMNKIVENFFNHKKSETCIKIDKELDVQKKTFKKCV